jgi:MFS family permease
MAARTSRTSADSLWRNAPFVRFWSAQSISQFGDRVSELAVPLIAVTDLHASAVQVSALTALIWAPNLLAMVMGAWVDHQPHKRRLMVAADLFRAVVLISLPIAAAAGVMTIGQLFAVAALTGAAGVLFNTSYSSFFAHLVPRSRYVEANAKLGTSRSASFVAGPALGGLLVQLLGAPSAVLADAVSFLASAALIGPLRVEETVPDAVAASVNGEAEPGLLRRAREGLRFIRTRKVLLAGLGCTATVNFFTFLAGTGLVVLFANRTLGLSAGAIGLAYGLGATGSLLGAVVAPQISRRIGMGRSIAVGAVLFPAPLALVALAAGPLWLRAAALGAAEFLSGFGVMLFDINLNSLQTSVIPDGMRSRISGAYSSINYGIRPVGALVGGLLATSLGLRGTLVIGAVGGALCLLWLLASPIPGIRSVDEPTPAATPGTPDAVPA